MVFTLFGVTWVMPKDVVEFLASWPGKFRRQKWGDNGPPLFDVVYMEGEECSDF